MTERILNFVYDLVQQQLIFVKGSSETEANDVALGLFKNDDFKTVLNELNGHQYVFQTRQGWERDNKSQLISSLEKIIYMIEKELNQIKLL